MKVIFLFFDKLLLEIYLSWIMFSVLTISYAFSVLGIMFQWKLDLAFDKDDLLLGIFTI